VFICLGETDACFLREAKQRKSEEERGKHDEPEASGDDAA